jgi:hypothetical protein
LKKIARKKAASSRDIAFFIKRDMLLSLFRPWSNAQRETTENLTFFLVPTLQRGNAGQAETASVYAAPAIWVLVDMGDRRSEVLQLGEVFREVHL